MKYRENYIKRKFSRKETKTKEEITEERMREGEETVGKDRKRYLM